MNILLKNILPTVGIIASALVLAYVSREIDYLLGMQGFSSRFFLSVGIVLLLAALCVRMWATVAFSKHQVAVLQLSAPDFLVREGPYKYSRNPLYVGIFLIMLGTALIFGSPSATVFSFLVLAFAHWWLMYREEPSLIKKFGQEYQNYMKTTCRWL